ncbi:heterokaryon incompatibility protein-domain-containing protein, partial [Staphylotrichum tortipilum]
MLPSRIVCVGHDNDGVFLSAQDTDSYYPTTARYACLSHCWGDSQPLRTLKSNLKAHHENIPWQQIPKTFQDAISYTRKLGVHYIWIDSLCIVQDDADDWLAESAKMADIYQNAYVTLAASAGRSSRDGLYHTPGNPHIVFGTMHNQPVSVGLRRPPKHPIYRGANARAGGGANADFPLFTRAWVFQERMLSPRIIHFGPYEMFWECRHEGVCACDSHRDPRYSSNRDLIASQALSSKSALSDRMRASSDEQRAALWRDLVEEYSQLQLTKSSDKLPAIEGLAVVMKPMRWGEEYIAGMWTGSPLDLLWTAKTERDFTQQEQPILTYPRASYRTQRWRAPSWSWASVDADI